MPYAILSPADAGSVLAIIGASHEPQLLLTAEQVVIAASRSFCRAFDLDPAKVVGRRLNDLGTGEWVMPRLQALLTATAFGSVPVAVCEIVLAHPKRPVRRLVVHVDILDGGPTDQVRLLLAFTDVTSTRTEERQKDQLIRRQAVLIQEVQHRTANTLQIIAGLLMQGARHVQSEEARDCLHDVHHRVMAIAAVQSQLSASGDDSVNLRNYLTKLCAGLATSMIPDPSRLSIRLFVEDHVLKRGDAASLGLIVTELVVNALKYAFPDKRSGRIVVNYRLVADDWVLSVSDNGVGIEPARHAQRTGLGTGIVNALSRNLHAEVVLENAQPGTKVTITHHQVRGPQTALSLASWQLPCDRWQASAGPASALAIRMQCDKPT